MRMPLSDRRLLAGFLLGVLILVPPAAFGGYREETHATSIEIALLPQFCWKQFEVPGAEGEQYTIHNCGVFMNHYCPGLIYFIRGKRLGTKSKSLGLLQHADIDVSGAERAIKEFPNCSIREHIEATRAELNHLLRMYGSKPIGAK
jgi:hypothetical protein